MYGLNLKVYNFVGIKKNIFNLNIKHDNIKKIDVGTCVKAEKHHKETEMPRRQLIAD